MIRQKCILPLLVLLWLAIPGPVAAQESTADSVALLTKEMYRLFNSNEVKGFFDVSERLKALCLKTGDKKMFYKTWGNQAIYSSSRISRSKSLEMVKEISDYAQQHDDKYGLYTATYVTGNLRGSLGQLKRAQQSYLQAIDYLKRYFPEESTATVYVALSQVCTSSSADWDKSLEYAKKALEDPQISDMHRLLAWSSVCYYYGLKNDCEAFDKAYAEREKAKKKYGRGYNRDNTVEFYRAMLHGEYQEALSQASKIKTKITRLLSYYKIYEAMGDYKNALYTYRHYKQYIDSVNTAEVRNQSEEYASQLNVARAENESKELRLRNQHLQLQQVESELERQRLKAEAAALNLEHTAMELASADMKLLNDSLDRSIQIARLSEYQSKMATQQEKEHTHHIMMLAAGLILLLTIAYLVFYMHRRQQQMKKLRDAYEQLEEHTTQRERMASELRIARDIQMSMVPRLFPVRPDVDLYGFMSPAKAVGGDMYDYMIDDNRLYFCVGDVSGKGIPASLFMAQAARLFRALAKQHLKPNDIATQMNSDLTENNESGMFITMFIGKVNLSTGRLFYCNAGHNPPVLDDHFVDMETNAPIGLWPDLEYVGESIDNIRHHKLFIYTDGLNEAEDQEQRQFGEEQMIDLLRQTAKMSARTTIEVLRQAVEKHRNGAEPSDDLTMMSLLIK